MPKHARGRAILGRDRTKCFVHIKFCKENICLSEVGNVNEQFAHSMCILAAEASSKSDIERVEEVMRLIMCYEMTFNVFSLPNNVL